MSDLLNGKKWHIHEGDCIPHMALEMPAKSVDFSIFSLPREWMVHQPVESKTLSVVLGNGPKCAFDLCTSDPFSDGPCASPAAK